MKEDRKREREREGKEEKEKSDREREKGYGRVKVMEKLRVSRKKVPFQPLSFSLTLCD